MPLSCPPAAQEFLLRLRFAGGKYSDFAEVLSGLPDSEANLLRAANQVFEGKLKEKLTNPSVALSMIGFLPSRNFLAASMVGGGANLLPGQPEIANWLRYALEGEAQGGEYAPDYFLAGIIFDLLTAELIPVSELAPKGGKKKGSGDFVSNIWDHSVSVTKAACKISKVIAPDFGLEKELVLDCLLHDIGKVGMHLLYPEEEKQLAMRVQTAENRWTGEHEVYGLAHDALGYLMLSRLGFLKDTSWVVLCHHQPFLAKKRGDSVFVRAMLLWLADHLLRYREHHRAKSVGDRLIQNWYQAVKVALPACTEKDFKNALSSALPA